MKQAWMGLALVMGLAGCTQAPPATPAEPAPPVAGEATVVPAPAFPGVLQASGTEPFWGVLVDGGRLTYTTPETMDRPRMFEGTAALKDDVLTVQGGEGEDAFVLTIRRGACSDGMSDLSYPFTSAFVLGKQTFKGCARDPSVPVEAP